LSGYLTLRVIFTPSRMFKDVLRLPGCSNLTYAERRIKLCLLTLELCRIYSDLINDMLTVMKMPK